MSRKHIGPDSRTHFPSKKKQTNHLLPTVPANSSCQLTSCNGGHREIRKVLSAPGLRLLHRAWQSRYLLSRQGFILEIIRITANSHKCNRIPANFQFIAPTVPLPASSNNLSALLLKMQIFKMQLPYFLAFQNPAGKLKDPFVVPSIQISAQFLNLGSAFGATG